MTSEVGTDIYKIQPAKYGNGIALISDYGDFMKKSIEDSLNGVLFSYERLTGVEIAILTVPSLYEADPEEYARTMFNKVKLGYSCLPKWMKIIIGRLVEDNVLSIKFKNGSSIKD